MRAWNAEWRRSFVAAMQGEGNEEGSERDWDVVVVGGGITGAGVFREFARQGLRVLLVEQGDFAWGTSSRSSKMVHGGLRYLASGAIGLTRESVRERQRLLREAPGLVDPLPFLYPHYRGAFPPPWLFGIVLTVYDFLAGIWNHRYIRQEELMPFAPGLRQEGLLGAMQFADAVTDDARLTLRVIREGMHDGGVALNYLAVEGVERGADQRHRVTLRDRAGGGPMVVSARTVINATGAWADALRAPTAPVIRPLRGSHLVFPTGKLPVGQTISFRHPRDKRPVFVFPWEGVTVVGTTDLDHAAPLDEEACITNEEVDYLLEATHYQLPAYPVRRADVLSTWSGVRPVISSGKGLDPSSEKREHSIWDEQGLITVSGGKLTTFRVIAVEILEHAQAYLPGLRTGRAQPVFRATTAGSLPAVTLSPALSKRLRGRIGPDLTAFSAAARAAELTPVAQTPTCWAELRWALAHECVLHLDDLLLRRTRLGNVLPEGGAGILDRVLALCGEELGWTADRQAEEKARYLATWRHYYALPAEDAA